MASKYVKMPDGTVKVVEVPEPTTSAPSSAEVEEFARQTGKPSFMSEAPKVADLTLRGGLLGLPGMVGDAAAWVGDKVKARLPALKNAMIPWRELSMLKGKTSPSEALFEATGGPLNEPETKTGQVIGNIGASTVGATLGGGPLSLGRRAAIGAGAGVGSEVGGAVAPDSISARLVGGLAGGTLTSLPSIIRPNAESMIRTSTKGATSADWRRAKVVEDTLKTEGIPHLKSQLLGPNSSLDDLVQQASTNPEVRPALLSAIRNIIPKTEGAIRRWSSSNLPINVNERRGMLADVQEVATKADASAVGAANQAYGAAMPDLDQVYSQGYIKNMRAELRDLAKSDKYGPESVGGKALLRFAAEKLPQKGEMPIAHLNNLLKDLNTLSLEEGWKGLPLGDLKGILRSYTPEFTPAREARSAVMSEVTTPMRQGLAGQITRMGGGVSDNKYTVTGDITKLVFPANKAQRAAITRLSQDIGAESVGWLLRDHLEQSLQAAGRGFAENPRAPADFVKAVAGNSAQRENLEAALFEVAKDHKVNPLAVRNGFYHLMNALKSFKDVKIDPGISAASAGFQAGTSPTGAAIAPYSRAGRFFWERASTKTYKQIADLVTSDDGLAKLEAIARSPTPQARQALITGILTNTAVTVNPHPLSQPNTRE